MVKTIKEEKLRWVLPIVRKETKLVETAKVCPYSKRNLRSRKDRSRKDGSCAREIEKMKKYQVQIYKLKNNGGQYLELKQF